MDYNPMWLLNGCWSCCNVNGLEATKFGGAERGSIFSISLLIECNELMVCGQVIVGNLGTGRKICCHLSGVIWSFWYKLLFIKQISLTINTDFGNETKFFVVQIIVTFTNHSRFVRFLKPLMLNKLKCR